MTEFRTILDSTTRISFEHLNPYAGHETVLLRFADGVTDRTTCVLVDAGEDVSLDETLGEDEYLGAVLLTHAHLDHYLSLPDVHRDGAPIYTSPATAQILGTVLESGQKHHGFSAEATDQVERQVSGLAGGWNSITESLDVTAVPAGHTPGACGFLLRFRDGFGPHHILITGDFTLRDAAGYPGFEPPAPFVDGETRLDALFLTQATSDTAVEQLTTAVSTVLKRVRDGSPTLVTASGLTGVHLAALLGTARSRAEITPPIIVAGHVAKLYADLDYDIPGVTAVPAFEDPDQLFERGGAVITGPEVPSTGGAKRCFESIRTDSNATVVQVHTGGFEPVDTAACTTYSVELNNHPPQAAIDELVADLNPFSVVITHDRTEDASRYHDGNYSFVWAPDYAEQHTLYHGGRWQSPDWVGEAGTQRVRSHHPRTDTGKTLGESQLGEFGRRGDIDLTAEPIRTSELPSVAAKASDVTETSDEPDVAPETEPAATTPACEDLTARIAALETAIADLTPDRTTANERVTVPARIVDAGDDITLLRVESAQLDGLAHGTELEIEVATDQLPISADTVGHKRS